MVIVGQYQFANLRSGKITRTGTTYVAATGSTNCATGQENTTPSYWRAYFGFDVSAIPSNAQVDAVVCVLALGKTQPFGLPETFQINYSIGDIVGAALNGDETEWDAGTLMVSLYVKPSHGQHINLNADGNDPAPHVNKAGKTDIKIWDASYQGTGDNSWGVIFNRGLIKCYLQITYSLPSATATGVGAASCSARIVAVGTGSATGVGHGNVAGAITAHASATATGKASGVAVGRVVCSASSTVVGRGEAVGRANIVASAHATGTGVATASMVGIVIYRPLAIHEASLSIGASHTSALSTRATHNANVTCDPKDEAIRGPRRAK